MQRKVGKQTHWIEPPYDERHVLVGCAGGEKSTLIRLASVVESTSKIESLRIIGLMY